MAIHIHIHNHNHRTKDADTPPGSAWISTESGSHILIGSDGKVIGGAGNKLNGKYYSTHGSVKGNENQNITKNGISDESSASAGAKEALQMYIDDSFYVNNYLRTGELPDDEDDEIIDNIKNDAKELTNMFDEIPASQKACKVNRTMELKYFEQMLSNAGIKDISDLKIGDELKDDGIMSTSTGDNPFSFGIMANEMDVLLKINLPAGTKAVDLGSGMNEHEAEILLKPGTKLKISKISIKDTKEHKYTIECEAMQ